MTELTGTDGTPGQPAPPHEQLIPLRVDPDSTGNGTAAVQDLEIRLPDQPHALADLTRAIGEAGVSLEGGGMFAPGTVHYLVSVPSGSATTLLIEAARRAGARSVRMNRVLIAHLDQETPGQLGLLLTRLADAGVWVRTQYSDHAGALVLVVAPEEFEVAQAAVATWDSTR